MNLCLRVNPTIRSFLLSILFLFTVLPVLSQERKKEFTIDDIYASSTFSSKSIRGLQWIEGGKAYSYLESDSASGGTSIWRYDVSSGKRSILIPAAKMVLKEGEKPFSIQNYTWSPDGKKVLFTGTLIARALKTGGNFFLYDLTSGKFRQLTDTDQEQVNVRFSPDSKMIGFVRNHDLYVLELKDGGREMRLTFDGGEHVFNGHFDWVYEEEFSIISAWDWSPDSKRIAYWQLDERRVPEFPIVNFLPLHQEIEHQRYPKAGDPNSIVKIGIVSVEPTLFADRNAMPEPKTIWADLGAPLDSTQDMYVPRMRWTQDPNQLMVQRMNRLQNQLDVTLVDARTGQAKILFTEREDTYVDVENTDIIFLKKSSRFLWLSERDGFKHIYLFGMDGKLVRQLTQGKWDVESVKGADEDRGVVYFTAGVTSPLDRDLYSVSLEGKNFKRITKESGNHSINFTPDLKSFIDSYSNANTPAKITLRKADGSEIRVLEEGKIPALAEYRISPKTFFTFTTSDGLELNGWMIKPQDFDPTKKHPVLMFVYSGPGSQTVRNSWGGGDYLWYQMLASKGYVIVSVDNRGTGARGKAFKSVTYKNLGKWETHDQIEAAKYLASLPFVDGSRIGVWGWSGGGYQTLLCMTLGADVFKAGVSVAPVTHWKFYDTIYTERYMSTPQLNPDGYEQSAPLTHAGKLKGKLMIVHGTADDNVHWQNTVSMVDALIKEGKQFETAFYPGGRHGIASGKKRAQLFTKITNFLLANL